MSVDCSSTGPRGNSHFTCRKKLKLSCSADRN